MIESLYLVFHSEIKSKRKLYAKQAKRQLRYPGCLFLFQ